METFQSKCSLAQQVPVERLDVTDIKDNTMPLGNRPLVEGVVAQDLE
jgi:hypothetical protein